MVLDVLAPRPKTVGQFHIARGQHGVHNDKMRKAVRHFHRYGQPQNTAPVLADQNDRFQIESFDERHQGTAMKIELIDLIVDRFVRAAESEKVRCNHPLTGACKHGNHLPI